MSLKDHKSAFVILVLVASLAVVMIVVTACENETEAAADITPYPVQVPLGLNSDYVGWIPLDDPLTKAKLEPGKERHFDPRPSLDDNISCATCHNPNFGFSNGVELPPGFLGKLGNRNSPTVFNRLCSKVPF